MEGSSRSRERSTPRQWRDLLRERGIMVNVRGGGLRVSPHLYNTEEDIYRLFENLS